MTFKTKSASFSLASAMALALLIGTAEAAAAEEVTVVAEPLPEDVLIERVSYADLNLASASGVQRLGTRVRGAVRRVCAPLDERLTIGDHVACRSFAWGGAKPQMEQAILRAEQIAATGTSAIAPVAIVIAAPQR